MNIKVVKSESFINPARVKSLKVKMVGTNDEVNEMMDAIQDVIEKLLSKQLGRTSNKIYIEG